ncbi:sigma-70 family RNA polymerase sigma factor [Falsibacillus pallidus]|uniref:RNA polymerase sigma-70 factor (ECF subfamily) n=1 Tax=Falsibacillus pallidus TaxID=493781 RepID=A0A370GQ28_9BACI|nr:sigma-70 family RNA polymerase sigma factor [Falsibacillus pallidus]RDI45420.1 RNA polymerase sigma-70 factor (ECF subfamily) [Falsibacillus pallidus]
MKKNDCRQSNSSGEGELNKEALIHEWMELYTKNVYLLAYSIVKDKDLAEDISQEVFLKCYRYMDRFRNDSSIKTWIYRITVNTSKDYIRKKGFSLLQFPLTLLDTFKKSASSEVEVLKMDEKERLLQLVLSLPQKYREVIILHYFQDLKIIEAADALQLNENTVKTRLARGRALLRDKIELQEGDVLNGS